MKCISEGENVYFENYFKHKNTRFEQNVEFLDASTKLSKATITFVLSTCLPACIFPHGTARLPRDTFS